MSNLKKAEDKLNVWLNKTGLKIGYDIDFPKYKILPTEVQLALLVLKEHGMNIIVSLQPKNKEDQKQS